MTDRARSLARNEEAQSRCNNPPKWGDIQEPKPGKYNVNVWQQGYPKESKQVQLTSKPNRNTRTHKSITRQMILATATHQHAEAQSQMNKPNKHELNTVKRDVTGESSRRHADNE